MKVNSIWISDAHLGSHHSQAKCLLRLLKTIEAKKIFLVGDIVDTGPSSISYEDWPDVHKKALSLLVDMAKSSESAIYIKGNHDENADSVDFLTGMTGIIDEFDIKDSCRYESLSGKAFHVMHGHQVDDSMNFLQLVLKPIKIIYQCLSGFEAVSKFKDNFKGHIAERAGYPSEMVKFAEKNNCDGVISGHLHRPTIESVNGFTYMNCGDWTGNNSFLVEMNNGEFKIIK